MSTVVRAPDGTIKLYTKGADTVIFERLAPKQEFSEPTLIHLEVNLIQLWNGWISVLQAGAGLRYRRASNALSCLS